MADLSQFHQKAFDKGAKAAQRNERRDCCPFLTAKLIEIWQQGWDSIPPRVYTITVTHTNGALEEWGFNSHHSATRCFRSWVGDTGISAIHMTDLDALELAKWVNPYV